MTIDDYFSAMERSLLKNLQIAQIEEPMICLASDNFNGLIRSRMFFSDRLAPADQPTLSQVLTEIESLLGG